VAISAVGWVSVAMWVWAATGLVNRASVGTQATLKSPPLPGWPAGDRGRAPRRAVCRGRRLARTAGRVGRGPAHGRGSSPPLGAELAAADTVTRQARNAETSTGTNRTRLVTADPPPPSRRWSAPRRRSA